MDEFHSRPSRMRAVDRANAAHTTWIGVSLLALLLVDSFALFHGERNHSTSAVMPEATVGQGGPLAGAPATNR
jgi:hypothetical protein